ncbi:TEA-domain-containing protein [Meredithblackwellia eburnea MCA 4105]
MMALSPTSSLSSLSSRDSSSSPTSSGMVRKRTLNDMASGGAPSSSMATYGIYNSINSSSPPSLVPSFEFAGVPHLDHHFLTSSPMSMSLSNSPRSSFAALSSSGSITDDEEDDDQNFLRPRFGNGAGRPNIKRRRTAPEILGVVSPSTPPTRVIERETTEKRGNGKDGQDVWPEDVEEAFHTALGIIPKLGRKKVMVHGKPCGRNELIADYIRRKTGKVRSRKQVSSHIQVLKNMRKHDAEFMNLVSEPLDGEDTFAPEAALAFFGLSPHSHVASAPMALPQGDSLLSPYSSSSLQRSKSASPALSDSSFASTANGGDVYSPQPISAPMSAASSLTNAMNDLHFPVPLHNNSAPVSCPIAPAALCLWADEAHTDSTFIFSELKQGASGPTSSISLEQVITLERQIPGLEDMLDFLPCQFLHTRVNLNVPSHDRETLATQLHTQLTLTSLQNLSLTCVTRIYSFGHEVLSLQEQVDHPSSFTHASSSSSTASSPASPTSPLVPGSSFTGSPANPLNHKYSYHAPFAKDFWSIFLRGAFHSEEGGKMLPTFAKSGDERAAFIMAISGLSVIQEFVVKSEEPAGPLVDGRDLSPGSALGDVVLVVTYDFECKEDSPEFLGRSTVSFLEKSRTVPSIPPPAPIIAPTVGRVEHLSLSTTRSSPVGAFEAPNPFDPPYAGADYSCPSKHSLSLHIPPPLLDCGSATPSPYSLDPIPPWPEVAFVHPAHGYTKQGEENIDLSLGLGLVPLQSVSDEVTFPVKGESLKRNVGTAKSGAGKTDVQDYFTELLGPSKYSTGSH